MVWWNPEASISANVDVSKTDSIESLFESLLNKTSLDGKTLWHSVILSCKKNQEKLVILKQSALFRNAQTTIAEATQEDKQAVLAKLMAGGVGSLSETGKKVYEACVLMSVADGGDGYPADTLIKAKELFATNAENEKEAKEQQNVGPDNYEVVANIYKQNGRSGETICSDFALAELQRMFGDRYIKIRNFGDSWDDAAKEQKPGGTRDMLTKLSGQYNKFFTIDQPASWTGDVLTQAQPGTMLTLHNPTSAYKFKPGTQETQVTHVLIKGHDGKRRDRYDGKIRVISSDQMTISVPGSGEQTLTIEGKAFVLHEDSRLYIPKIEAMPAYKPTTIVANDPKLYPQGMVPTEISGTYFAQILADRYHLSKSYISQLLIATGYGLTTKYNPQDLSIDLVIPPKTTISHEYSFKAPESDDPEIQGKITEIRQYAAEAKIPPSRTENLVAIFLKENAGGRNRALAKGLYHTFGGLGTIGYIGRNIGERITGKKPDSFGMFQISRQTFINLVRFPVLKADADQETKKWQAREIERIKRLRTNIEQSFGQSINREAMCTGPMDDAKKKLIETILMNNHVSFLCANELQLQTENIFTQHLRNDYDGIVNGDDLALTSLTSHNLGIPRTHALIGQQNLFALAQKIVGNAHGSKPFYLDGLRGEKTKELFEKVKSKLGLSDFAMIAKKNGKELRDIHGNFIPTRTESGQPVYTHIRYQGKDYALTDHAVSSPSGMKALFTQLTQHCEACKDFVYMSGLSVKTLKTRQTEGKTHLHYAGEFLNDFCPLSGGDDGG